MKFLRQIYCESEISSMNISNGSEILFRFLDTNEYIKTKPLAEASFGISKDTDDYYENTVYGNRIAVFEENGTIISMLHLSRMIFDYGDSSELVWYILYVATLPEHRDKGNMKKLFSFVFDALRNEGERKVFLAPVNKDVYKSSGFCSLWSFAESEREILLADDDISECMGASLCGDEFIIPFKISKADTIADISFQKFDEKAFCDLFDLFSKRRNKSCDSVPLDAFIWCDELNTEYAVIDNRAVFLKDDKDGILCGCLPFCNENELFYYFKLQEKYYNFILKKPFVSFYADMEGIEALKESALSNYDVIKDDNIYDYIYSGDDLRNLQGKKFANKRNRINKFDNDYKGRWKYRSLAVSDIPDIKNFIDEWYADKISDGEILCFGKTYSAAQMLDIEIKGTYKLLRDINVLSKLKMGGIYIDGKLCAISIGAMNRKENMAVIEIEKAFSDMEGLYQLINREFLLHEFPDAEVINREDDAGLAGLQKAKSSYNPIILEYKYNIFQKIHT